MESRASVARQAAAALAGELADTPATAGNRAPQLDHQSRPRLAALLVAVAQKEAEVLDCKAKAHLV